MELGALGANFVGVVFIAIATSPESVQDAIEATMALAGGRVYGGMCVCVCVCVCVLCVYNDNDPHSISHTHTHTHSHQHSLTHKQVMYLLPLGA